MKKIIIFLFFISFVTVFSREKLNIILAVDYSGSMSPYFSEVKKYLTDEIVTIMEDGDYLFYIKFGTTALVKYAGKVDGDRDRDDIKKYIARSQPDQGYTDIGLALETMFTRFDQVSGLNQKNILLFITDGLNAPPPWSKYYTNIYKDQDEFYKRAELIKNNPWKVMILGIGEQTEARDLSKMFDGEYIEVSKNLQSGMLSEKIGDFIGHLEFVTNKEFSIIGMFGKKIDYKIESTYVKEKGFTMSGITIKDIKKKNGKNWVDVKDSFTINKKFPLTINVTPDKSYNNYFTFNIPNTIHSGEYKGVMVLNTDKKSLFIENQFEVSFKKPVFPLIVIISFFGLLIGSVIGAAVFIKKKFF